MSMVDAIVIGGGLAGCSAALHLRKAGASVTLVERGRCGAQASGVNYGGVRQQGRHPAELPLARRSRAIWRDMPTLIGTDCEFVASGHLKLARTDADMAELAAYKAMAAGHGLELELVDAADLGRRYSYLGPDLAGGSLCAEDGQANPRLAAPSFARKACALGAAILEETEIVAARFDGSVFEVRTAADAVVKGRALVNVAGAWGAGVAGWFGEDVPEGVMAPNMAVTEPLPRFLGPNLGMCGGGIYLRQTPHGSVVFGAGLGIADRDRRRARPLAEVTAEAAKLAVALVPRLRNALLVRTWTGIEGRMPDGLPVLGSSLTTPGLVHAFGFSGHGFQLGPAVGAVLAELVLEGESRTTIDGLSIGRFRTAACDPPAQAKMPSAGTTATTRATARGHIHV